MSAVKISKVILNPHTLTFSLCQFGSAHDGVPVSLQQQNVTELKEADFSSATWKHKKKTIKNHMLSVSDAWLMDPGGQIWFLYTFLGTCFRILKAAICGLCSFVIVCLEEDCVAKRFFFLRNNR